MLNADWGVPVLVGEDPLDYVCSRCFQVLCEGMRPGALEGLIIRCACGTVNRVPETRLART